MITLEAFHIVFFIGVLVAGLLLILAYALVVLRKRRHESTEEYAARVKKCNHFCLPLCAAIYIIITLILTFGTLFWWDKRPAVSHERYVLANMANITVDRRPVYVVHEEDQYCYCIFDGEGIIDAEKLYSSDSSINVEIEETDASQEPILEIEQTDIEVRATFFGIWTIGEWHKSSLGGDRIYTFKIPKGALYEREKASR